MQTQPKAASTIEDAFRPAFEEISRRSAVARTHDAEQTSQFPSTGEVVRTTFHVPGQDFALVTLGTPVLAPVPKDAECPAMRVYGAFASREEAVEHAATVREHDGTCSLLVVKMREWILFPTTVEVRDNPELATARTQKRIEEHDAAKRAGDAAFTTRVRAGGVDDGTPHAVAPRPSQEERECQEAEALVYPPPRRIRGGDVRGQSVAAVVVLPDPAGECMIQVLGCFESTVEADVWVSKVASREIVDMNIIVMQLCEWSYPNGLTSGRQHYRIDELQRIMDASDRNPQAVVEYKKWKQQQEAEDAELKGVEEGVELTVGDEEPLDMEDADMEDVELKEDVAATNVVV